MKRHILGSSVRSAIKGSVEVQRNSWERFLDPNDKGWTLEGALSRAFPVADPGGVFTVSYHGFRVNNPVHDESTCTRLGLSYESKLEGDFSITVWEEFSEDGAAHRTPVTVVRKWIPLGMLPLMTDGGTFVMNGSHRTCIGLVRRMPGTYFQKSEAGDVQAQIKPDRGSWAKIRVSRGRLVVELDRRKSLPLMALLIGLHDDLEWFQHLLKDDLYFDLSVGLLSRSGVNVARRQKSPMSIEAMKGSLVLLEDIVLAETICTANGSLYAGIGTPVSSLLNDPYLPTLGKKAWRVTNRKTNAVAVDSLLECGHILYSPDEAANLVLNRAGSARPAIEGFRRALEVMLIAQHLGVVGRNRDDRRFGKIKDSDPPLHMVREDYVRVTRYLIQATDSRGAYVCPYSGHKVAVRLDDVDDLASRRVRLVGEQLGRQAETALAKVVRQVVENMNTAANDIIMEGESVAGSIDPAKVIPGSTFGALMHAFFTGNSMQLTDEVNVLSALDQGARLTALGPGGLSHQTTSGAVRDVHPSQFGRVCPIQTPEGANAGLITTLTNGAIIDTVDGRILAPYRNLQTGETEYLSAEDEVSRELNLATFGTDLSDPDSTVTVHRNGSVRVVLAADVTHIEVSPVQAISTAAGCSPFLQHNDANRALMGANMQRQAVPLVSPKAPLIATGLERQIGEQSARAVRSPVNGEVVSADAGLILIRDDRYSSSIVPVSPPQAYPNNQGFLVRNRLRVKPGQKVVKGQVLTDGLCLDDGEFAHGKNVVVAYMCWHGLNFEDAVVISRSVVERGLFTTTVVENFVVDARVYPKGNGSHDEITADMPDVSSAELARLDSRGVIAIGSLVKPGDIMVGRVSPKPDDHEPNAIDSLMLAIFGGKIGRNVKSTPFRAPGDVEGTVIGVRIVQRDADHSKTKLVYDSEQESLLRRYSEIVRTLKRQKLEVISDAKAFAIEAKIEEVQADMENLLNADVPDTLEPGVLQRVTVRVAKNMPMEVGDKFALRHGHKGIVSRIEPTEDMPVLPDGTPVDVILNPMGCPSRMNPGQLLECHLGLALWMLGRKVSDLAKGGNVQAALALLRGTVYHNKGKAYRRMIESIQAEGPNALRTYLIGLSDGVPVSSSSFHGAREADIDRIFSKIGWRHGRTVPLFDGQTGEAYDCDTSVGVMYLMRLNHNVSDKIHARSTGPYTVITQQPLGGRAQNGGQRLGEMEVWALEAYGAAHILQESLTVRSDDVVGRDKAYASISEGKPFSLGEVVSGSAAASLLMMELRSLGLDLEVIFG